jgi:hypothetical protein
MRFFRILLIVFGLVVGLPLGAVLLFTTMQATKVTQKTRPTPQVLSAVQLAEKGAPENLHVELTGYTFGQPVIETNKEGWVCTWLPVEPAPSPETAKHVIFFRAAVRDQPALDEILKRSRLEALVTTPLPANSRWRVTCGAALRKAYPDLDMSQALFLAEPRLSLFGQSIELSDPQLYDASYESIGAWGGAVLILFAFVSLYLLVSRGRAAGDVVPPDADVLRAQLETERPESFHQARTSGTIRGILGYGILAGILLPGVVLFTVAAVLAQAQGKPLFAVIFTFIALPLFFGGRAAVRAFLRRFRWPTDIALCPTGLRWRQGRQRRNILWAEVAEVRRDIKQMLRMGQTGLVGALAQLNNPTPPIIVDTVWIELHSGESYRMSPSMITNYFKFAETAPTLWNEDELRRQSAGVTSAWLQSLARP